MPLPGSAKNSCPGPSRPLLIIFSGGISKTPASLAMTSILSEVTSYLQGLNPFLSRIAPTRSPSVAITSDGPSHGSTNDA